jgi:O-Antigen ligase
VTPLYKKNGRFNAPFSIMVIFLGLLFLMGGGARSDIQSLAILRPISVAVLGYALWGLLWEQVKPFRVLVFFGLTIMLTVALHLIPLPHSVWTALPGRELLTEIDRTSGLASIWRPLSFAPSETWNAFYALFTPLAILFLMIRLTPDQRFMLVPVIIMIGLISGFIGLIQVISSNVSPIYYYKITNNGSAVGMFANRNHQAVFLACLFPMLAVFATTRLKTVEQARIRAAFAVGAGIFLIPLILVTGSRAGLIIALLGLSLAGWLYSTPEFTKPAKRKIQRVNMRYVAIGALIICLVLITALMSRAQALERLLTRDGTEELRLSMWPAIVDMALKYFPFGSGFGTFVGTYQIDEPLSLIDQNYVNHAHNDWLEVLMTGGLPGLLMIGFALAAWFRVTWVLIRSRNQSMSNRAVGRLGAFIVLMLAVASIGDYPLRVPSLAALFVLAAVWAQSGFANAYAAAPEAVKRGGTD